MVAHPMEIAQTSRTGSSGGGRRGQSEVVGTILLVAIVIAIAALIGQFVLGLDIINTDQAVAPQASFETNVNADGNLTIEHNSGDTLDVNAIAVSYNDTDHDVEADVGDEWEAGERITIDSDISEGDTVRIVWQSSDTDDSDVLFEYEY